MKADFGFALDGDADRIGLVDEKGQIVPASIVGALVGLEVLQTHPGARMLYDLRSSAIVKEVWEKAGATTEMCMVGHALIKKMMATTKADFASELSMHLYYADLFNLESSDLSLLYILRMLSRDGQTLSGIVKPLQKYFHSGEINFKITDKEAILKKLEKKYTSKTNKISHLDGLWVKTPWGMISVRASNTEPVLRLNLEADSQEKMEEELQKIEKIINSAD